MSGVTTIAVPQKNSDVVGLLIGRNDVRPLVAIHIANGDTPRTATDIKGRSGSRLKASLAVTQEHYHGIACGPGDQVRPPVGVDVDQA